MTEIKHNAGVANIADQRANPKQVSSMRDILNRHLTDGLILPKAAVDWLLDFWDAIQFFDDVADNDAVTRAELNQALHAVLVGMPSNPFFIAHASSLLPAAATLIIKWQASDAAERAGEADARSYMWRAGYYDLIALATYLTHGHEVATEMARNSLGLYGESLEDYLKEFPNA